MKKMVGLLLAGIMTVFLLAGCGSEGNSGTTDTKADTKAAESQKTDAGTEEAEKKSFKIGVDVANLTNDTFVQFVNVFQKYCDERGWSLITASCDNDPAKQRENLENMITAGCDAIFSENFDITSTPDIYQEIKDRGIVLVAYEYESDIADYCWYCDNYTLGYAVGQMAGEWVNENLDGEANVVFLQNDAMDFLKERGRGNVDGFTEICPSANILTKQHCVASEAADVMESVLQGYPDLNIVIALTDTAGFNAYQILSAEIERNGYDESRYGMFANDGSDAVLPLIAGDTCYRGSIDLGLKEEVPMAVMEAIEDALTGDGTKYPHDNYFPVNAVTMENVADYMAE